MNSKRRELANLLIEIGWYINDIYFGDRQKYRSMRIKFEIAYHTHRRMKMTRTMSDAMRDFYTHDIAENAAATKASVKAAFEAGVDPKEVVNSVLSVMDMTVDSLPFPVKMMLLSSLPTLAG